MPSPTDPIPILLGTTASGKTAVALALALLLGGEVVSLDARAVYRGMDVSTAKPTPAERARVPHHLLDVCEVEEAYNARRYRDDAARCVEGILDRGKRPVFAGGSTLYLKAITEGLFEGPGADPDLRARLEALPTEELARRLGEVDAEGAARIDARNRVRLVRALEVFEQTGRPISQLQAEARPLPYRFKKFGLRLDRAALYARIDARVDRMVAEGLLDEVRRLAPRLKPGTPAAKTHGVQELIPYLEGRCSLEAALAKVKQHTRNYAKRQLTWHRRDPGIVWLDAEAESPQALARRVVEGLKSAS